MHACIRIGMGGLLLSASSVLSVDLGSYNGCDATDAEFTTTTIFQGTDVPASGGDNSKNSVLKVAFNQPAAGVTDVYFIQKWGEISRYNGATKSVEGIGSLNANHKGEQGLIGIALDPNFNVNRYLYVNYSFQESSTSFSFRISRLTLGSNGKIDLPSEKILIKIPCQNKDWHTAGAMMFDAFGDLYCNIGDNQQTEATAGNTADLRGAILRIHPDANAAGGYTIPQGNFGEVFSNYFKSQHNADLATQYSDTSKVKAEIFVKGTRNAYTLGVEPFKRWIAWGEVGPDQGKVSEEYNMVKKPIFGGWPYFAGEENLGAGSPSGGPASGPYGTPVPLQGNPNGLTNNFAGIAGVKSLPPMTNPIFVKQRACAMGGPIFTYDGANPSPTQFPPQFNDKWLISDCNGSRYGYRLLTFDSAGNSVVGNDNLKIFSGTNVHQSTSVVDMKQGPDGSLYIVDWGQAGIYRVDYTGTCKDPNLKPVGLIRTANGHVLEKNPIAIMGNILVVSLEGDYQIKVVDIAGRSVFLAQGDGKQAFRLPQMGPAGVYHIEVSSNKGKFTRRMLNTSP